MKKDLASTSEAKGALATDTDKKASVITLEADKAKIETLKVGLTADQKLLAQASDAFDQAQTGLVKGTETYAITQLPVAPDPSARYVAKLDHNWLRDDTVKIDVTTGLLSSATTNSADQSLNSLVSLAQTAITVATFVGSGVPLIPSSSQIKARALKNKPDTFPIPCTYEFSEVFDPLNPADVAYVNAELQGKNAAIQLITRFNRDTKAASGARSAITLGPSSLVAKDTGPYARTAEVAKASSPAAVTSGFAYRTATSVIVTVEPVEMGSDWTWDDLGPRAGGQACPLIAKPLSTSQLAVVPDSRTAFVVDADVGVFTTTTHSYAFSSGMLTEHAVTRPSEIAAPIVALGQLAQSIVAIPGAILKFRYDYTNSEDNLAKARSTLVTDQIGVTNAILVAQKQVDDSRAALIKAQFGDTQAWADAQTALLKAQQSLDDARAASNKATTPSPSPSQ